MELYAKGQLSFLILTCLLDRDFYGLDIISEISSRSNGKINLKKPSVYSNLTRMEKQGYVSSYLRSSDFGPNRKYYSLTEKGRGFYQELKAYFDYNNIDVFRDFVDVDVQTDNFLNKDYTVTVSENVSEPVKVAYTTEYIHNHPISEEVKSKQEENIDKSINDEEKEEQDDFFDFSSLEDTANSDNAANESTTNQDTTSDEEVVGFIQENNINDDNIISKIEESTGQTINITEEELESYQKEVDENDNNQESIIEAKSDDARFLTREKEEESKELNEQIDENIIEKQPIQQDDAKFLPNENIDEYNKRLFDISKDINKIKRRSSFAEDQIAITATDPLYLANEKKKANMEEFKNSLLENKNKYAYRPLTQYSSPIQQPKLVESKPSVEEEVKKDDAKLIVGRITPDDVEKARKIEPPKIKIVSENTKDTRLPAPKRDTNVDPSHREILNKLYSKTKDNASVEVRNDAIYDYNDLKDFYESQSISFDIYHKAKEKKTHNTNLLYLIISLSVLITSLLSSVLLYVILLKTGLTNKNTNFLYILLPSLLIIDVAYKIYNYKIYTSGMPAQLNPQWKMLCYYLLVSCIIVGFNLIFGLATKEFSLLATTLLLPLILALIIIPGRYYLKRFVLIKYWK